MKCINTNSQEFKNLLNNSNLPEEVLKSNILIWQNDNKGRIEEDSFPTLEELFILNNSNKIERHHFETLKYDNNLTEGFAFEEEKHALKILSYCFRMLKDDSISINENFTVETAIKNAILDNLKANLEERLEKGTITPSQEELIYKIGEELEKEDSVLWEKFNKKLINSGIELRSIKEFKEDFDSLDTDELPTYWDNLVKFKTDAKSNVLGDIKDLISTTLKTDPNWDAKIDRTWDYRFQTEIANRDTLTGIPEPLEFDDVYSYLVNNISGKTLEESLEFLRTAGMYFDRTLLNLYYRLISSDDYIKNAWYNSFNMVNEKTLLGLVSTNEDKLEFNVAIGNKSSLPEYTIADIWEGNITKMLKENESLDKVKLRKEIQSDFAKVTRLLDSKSDDSNKQATKLLTDIFAKLKIDIVPSSINYLIRLDNENREKDIDLYSTVINRTLDFIEDENESNISNRLRELAKTNVMFRYNLADSSYLDSKGNLRYGYQQHSYLSEWFKIFRNKETRDVLLEKYNNVEKLKYSNWINIGKIFDDTYNKDNYLKGFANDFELFLFEANKNSNMNISSDYADMFADNWNLNKLLFYLSDKNESKAIVPITMVSGDTAHTNYTSVKRIPINYSMFSKFIIGNEDVSWVDSELHKALLNTIKQEISEMIIAKNQMFEQDTDGTFILDKGNIKLKEGLNINQLLQGKYIKGKKIFDDKGNAIGNVFKFNNSYVIKDGVQKTLSDYLNPEKGFFRNIPQYNTVDAFILDNSTEINNYLNDFVKQQYNAALELFKNVRGTIETANNGKLISKYINISNDNLFESSILEWALNDFINNVEMATFWGGDLSEYKNSTDANKRYSQWIKNGMSLALGNSLLEKSTTFKGLTVNDVTLKSAILDNLVEHLGEEESKEYSEINTTDGISIITLDEFITRTKLAGRTGKFKKLFDKLKAGEKINPSEYKLLIQSQKYFYYSRQYNPTFRSLESHQIKNSVIVIIPQYILPGSDMEAVYNMMVNKNIGQINLEGAVKVGTKNIVNLTDKNGKLVNLDSISDEIDSSIVEYNHSDLRIQQDIPSHILDEDNTLGIQIFKKIWEGVNKNAKYSVDGKTLSGQELFDLTNRIYVANIKDSYNELKDRLVDENGLVSEEKIAKILEDALTQKKASNNQLESIAINENGKTNMPLYTPAYEAKYLQTLTSLFTNGVTRQHIPGLHVALVPSIYNNRSKKITEKELETLYKNNEANFTSEIIERFKSGDFRLKSEHYGKGNKILRAEVLLPAWSKEFYKNGQLIDINSIEPRLLEMIGYRIPTEDKHSMITFKVVGFIESGASQITMPDDFVIRSGSDFDLDTLYIMSPSFEVIDDKLSYIDYIDGTDKDSIRKRYERFTRNDKEYKISLKEFSTLPIEEQNTRLARNNKIITNLSSILLHKDHFKQLYKPNSYKDTKEAVADFNKFNNEVSNSSRNLLMFQDNNWYRNQNLSVRNLKGKAVATAGVVSILAWCNTSFHSLLSPVMKYDGKELKNLNLDSIEIMEQTDSYIIGRHKWIGNNKKGTWTNSLGDLVSNQVSQISAHILDAVKYPMGANLNDYTLGVYSLLPIVGVSHYDNTNNVNGFLYSEYLINHPVIKELSDNYFESFAETGIGTDKFFNIRSKYLIKLYNLAKTKLEGKDLGKYLNNIINSIDKQILTNGDNTTIYPWSYKAIMDLAVKAGLKYPADMNKQTPISLIELKKLHKIGSNPSTLEDIVRIIKLLENWNILRDTSKILVNAVNTFNTDKLGAGPTLDVTHDLNKNIRTLTFKTVPNPKFDKNSHKEFKPNVEGELNIKNNLTVIKNLGSKTQSENVILPQDIGGVKKDIFSAIPKFKKENPNGIIAYRVNNSKPLIQNLKEQNAIGNPFNWNKYGQGAATNMFIDWIVEDLNYDEPLATKEYRTAVIEKIKSSKQEKILYYDEFNRPTHATALDYLINKYDWNNINKKESKSVDSKITSKSNIDEQDNILIPPLIINDLPATVAIYPDSFSEEFYKEYKLEIPKTSAYPSLAELKKYSNDASLELLSEFALAENPAVKMFYENLSLKSESSKRKANSYILASLVQGLPFFHYEENKYGEIFPVDYKRILGIDTKDNYSVNINDISQLKEFNNLTLSNKIRLILADNGFYKDWINKYDSNNILPYLNILDSEEDVNKNGYIKINFIKSGRDIDSITRSFNDMWYSFNPFLQSIAKDLVRYVYKVDGLSFSFTGLSDIIPVNILYRDFENGGINYSNYLRDRVNNLGIEYFDEQFMDNFHMSNFYDTEINPIGVNARTKEGKINEKRPIWTIRKDDLIVIPKEIYDTSEYGSKSYVRIRRSASLPTVVNNKLSSVIIGSKDTIYLKDDSIEVGDEIEIWNGNAIPKKDKTGYYSKGYTTLVNESGEEYKKLQWQERNNSGKVIQSFENNSEISKLLESKITNFSKYVTAKVIAIQEDERGNLQGRIEYTTEVRKESLKFSKTAKKGGLDLLYKRLYIDINDDNYYFAPIGKLMSFEFESKSINPNYNVVSNNLEYYRNLVVEELNKKYLNETSELELTPIEILEDAIKIDINDERKITSNTTNPELLLNPNTKIQDIKNNIIFKSHEGNSITEFVNSYKNFNDLSNEDKIKIYKYAIDKAFSNDKRLRDALLHTGESQLILWNTDTFLGVKISNNTGLNTYGKLLMEKRSKLQKQSKATEDELQQSIDFESITGEPYLFSTDVEVRNEIDNNKAELDKNTNNLKILNESITDDAINLKVFPTHIATQKLNENWNKEFIERLNKGDKQAKAKALIIKYEHEVKELEALKNKLQIYDGENGRFIINNIIGNDVTERQFAYDMRMSGNFIQSATNFSKLEVPLYKEGMEDVDRIISETISKINDLSSQIINLQNQRKRQIKLYFINKLTPLSRNPEIIKGLVTIFDATDDLTYGQFLLDSLGDSKNPLLALVYKRFNNKVYESRIETRDRLRKFDKMYNSTFGDLSPNEVERIFIDNFIEPLEDGSPSGKFITKYDKSFYNTYFDYINKLNFAEKINRRNSREWFRAKEELEYWKRNNTKQKFSNNIVDKWIAAQNLLSIDTRVEMDLLKVEEELLLEPYKKESKVKTESGNPHFYYEFNELSKEDKLKLIDIKNRSSKLTPESYLKAIKELELYNTEIIPEGKELVDIYNEWKKAYDTKTSDKWILNNLNKYIKLLKSSKTTIKSKNIKNISKHPDKIIRDLLEERSAILKKYKYEGELQTNIMTNEDINRINDINASLTQEYKRYFKETRDSKKESTIPIKFESSSLKLAELHDLINIVSDKQELAKLLSDNDILPVIFFGSPNYETGDVNPANIYYKYGEKEDIELPLQLYNNYTIRKLKDEYKNLEPIIDNVGNPIPSKDSFLNPKWTNLYDSNDKPLNKYGEFYSYLNKELGELTNGMKDNIVSKGFIPAMEVFKEEKLKDKILRKMGNYDVHENFIIGKNGEVIRFVPIDYLRMFGESKTIIYSKRNKNENYNDYESRILKELSAAGHVYNSLEEVKKYNEDARKKRLAEHGAKISYNISDIMNKFIKSAVRYKHIKSVEDEMWLANEAIGDLEIKERTHRGKEITDKVYQETIGKTKLAVKSGDKSLSQKRFELFLEMIMYDQYEADEKMAKYVRLLQNYTSAVGMWFNTTGAIRNIAYGNSQIALEKYSGLHFNVKDANIAEKEYLRNMVNMIANAGKETSTSITDALIKEFDILESQAERGSNVESRIKSDIFKHLMRTDSFYIQHHIGEHYMQNKTLLAMLHSNRIVDGEILDFNMFYREDREAILLNLLDENGKEEFKKFAAKIGKEERQKGGFDTVGKYIISSKNLELSKKFNEVSKNLEKEAELRFNEYQTVHSSYELKDGLAKLKDGIELKKNTIADFENRVKAVNQKIHGIYNKMDSSTIQHLAIGRMAIQFRKHLRPGWNKRFGRTFGQKQWNERLSKMEVPMYTTLWDYLRAPRVLADKDVLTQDEVDAKAGLKSILTSYKNFLLNAKLYWNVMSKEDKAAVRQVAIEMLFFAMVLTLGIGLKAGFGDDDEYYFANLAMYVLDGLKTDTLTYTPWYGWINESKKLLKSPVAGLNTIENAIKFTASALNYVNPLSDDEDLIFRGSRYNGERKVAVYGGKLVPLVTQGIKMYGLSEITSYYKLFSLD